VKHPILYGVYLAKFPYLETNESKLRPVIVISSPTSDYGVITIVPISSREVLESVDFTIDGWEQCGLLKPSVARVHRISTTTKESLDNFLGSLEQKDINSLKAALTKLLNL
jgi:mRNA interferase MazF